MFICPLRPQHCLRARQGQETVLVEVGRHGWQRHLLATVKRLQEEEPTGRLRQELFDILRDLPLRTEVTMLLQVLSRGVTRSSGAGHTASAAKRKSSGSATRGESELRKQLLHISNEMDKSENARMEREEGFLYLKMHRDESMHEMEI